MSGRHGCAIRPLLLSLCVAGNASAADEITRWVEARAAPLSGVDVRRDHSDLEPLRALVGDARVVGLGEGMHNTHEFWALRNRLFAYLVEELGFTAIALETGYLDGLTADAYVQGAPVDRDVAAQAVFSWAAGVFAENRELVDWMRSHNAGRTPEKRVRLYGLEMLACGEFDGRWLLEPALAFLADADAGAARELRSRFEPLLPKFNEDDYAGSTEAEKSALLTAIEDLVSLYERNRGGMMSRTVWPGYERAYRIAIVARQLLTQLRLGGRGRDVADAQNLRWVLEREGARGRVFVFAHNGHLAKRASWGESRGSPMGELLEHSLPDRMVVIGTVFDRGTGRELFGLHAPVNDTFPVPPSEPDSLNGLLAKAGRPLFLLDLRSVPDDGPLARRLAQPVSLRDVAGYDSIDVRASFDALLFVGEVSPQRLVSPTVGGGCFKRYSRQTEAR